MANPIGKQDDVVNATDKLMKALLTKAEADPDNVDFALQVVQSATRWTAVKNRMSLADPENSFDEWRAAIADGSGAGPGAGAGAAKLASAASPKRKARTGPKKGRLTAGSNSPRQGAALTVAGLHDLSC